MIRGREAGKNQSSSSILDLSNILSTLGNVGPGSGFLLEISGAAFGTQEGLGKAFWPNQIPVSEYRDPESRPPGFIRNDYSSGGMSFKMPIAYNPDSILANKLSQSKVT